MKDKAFARAVNREDIVRGAAELEMSLDDDLRKLLSRSAPTPSGSVSRGAIEPQRKFGKD